MHLETEEDWRQWIDDGEKRNPYIPNAPDEIYRDSGWAGWEDFLNGPIEDLTDLLDAVIVVETVDAKIAAENSENISH